MKKLLLMAILLSSVSEIFAFGTMGNWRWRKDDGSQTTATWIAAQNTSFVLTDTTSAIRLRIEIYNDPTEPGGFLDGAILEDSSNLPGATWDTIKLTADANAAFVLAGASPNVTNLQATTQQLTSPHATLYQAGQVIVSSESLPSSTVGNNTGTEYEYVIKPTTNIQPSVTYYFRVNATNYFNPLPTLTTGAVLPVQLVNFSVIKDGKKVKLQWSTASEQNNDRFEVEKSIDGSVWKNIATVKGMGTSSQAQHYNSYDASPASGINYYRLKQVDVDGRSNISDIRSIRFNEASKAIISVSPNPVRGVVNFKLDNISASNLVAVFSDVNGTILYQQKYKNVQANTINKLNLSQPPAAGVYILKLQADGLSESIRVVVQ